LQYAIRNFKKDIFPLMHCILGKNVNRSEPITICPLIYNGLPFIAGFEGIEGSRWGILSGSGWNTAVTEVKSGIKVAGANIKHISDLIFNKDKAGVE
jgi:hypothetical protein